ncbi:MAG: peptide deformylase [Thermoanaerobaculia bacterium]
MILKVSRLGHPVLRQQSQDAEVDDIRNGKYDQLIEDMMETMHAYQGVGLAGPQVHLPLRVFVFELEKETARRKSMQSVRGAFFNATYEPEGDEKVLDWEGCLSVPFLGGEVPRYRKIRVHGIDPEGNEAEMVIEDYLARIFQHEIDHTRGQVYLDRMPDLSTLAYTIVL